MRTTLKTLIVALACATGGSAQAQKSALPGGGWLELDKHGLHLLSADGVERAKLTVRAKQLDMRSGISGSSAGVGDGQVLAILIDSNTEHVVPVVVDPVAGTLRARSVVPAVASGTEAACLYRDAQHIDYVFQVARDGQAEQWLLKGDTPRLVRKLALPPHLKHCQVDDVSATLRVDEPEIGTWAYNAEAEDGGWRKLLARGKPLPAAKRYAIVMTRAQTEPMPRLGDAADDPAIWVNPRNPADSRVLGTNKKQGLLVYDMQGRQTQLLESGRLNNVDLRQDIDLGGQRQDFALATQRDENSMVLYTIASDGMVAEAARFPTPLERIYGMCLYRPASGALEAFINDKDGTYLHYRIGHDGKAFTSTLLRRFKLASQPEGCVADDRTGRLFMGEEKRGVWAMSANAEKPDAMRMILPVGASIKADVEGMAIYHGQAASYLVVSSQGDSSYVVLDAAAPHKVRGRFRIGINLDADIDGTSETDGLEVTSANLGGPYARGLLVVQDGYKRLPDGPQNFKYVAWDDVARALNLVDKP
jgi:3-phytase